MVETPVPALIVTAETLAAIGGGAIAVTVLQIGTFGASAPPATLSHPFGG